MPRAHGTLGLNVFWAPGPCSWVSLLWAFQEPFQALLPRHVTWRAETHQTGQSVGPTPGKCTQRPSAFY